MSEITVEPRPSTPFPPETGVSAGAAVDPLAGDWSEGLRGPVRALGIPTPRLLTAAGQEQAPAGHAVVAPAADDGVEAPDAWSVAADDPLHSVPPPPAGGPVHGSTLESALAAHAAGEGASPEHAFAAEGSLASGPHAAPASEEVVELPASAALEAHEGVVELAASDALEAQDGVVEPPGSDALEAQEGVVELPAADALDAHDGGVLEAEPLTAATSAHAEPAPPHAEVDAWTDAIAAHAAPREGAALWSDAAPGPEAHADSPHADAAHGQAHAEAARPEARAGAAHADAAPGDVAGAWPAPAPAPVLNPAATPSDPAWAGATPADPQPAWGAAPAEEAQPAWGAATPADPHPAWSAAPLPDAQPAWENPAAPAWDAATVVRAPASGGPEAAPAPADWSAVSAGPDWNAPAAPATPDVGWGAPPPAAVESAWTRGPAAAPVADWSASSAPPAAPAGKPDGSPSTMDQMLAEDPEPPPPESKSALFAPLAAGESLSAEETVIAEETVVIDEDPDLPVSVEETPRALLAQIEPGSFSSLAVQGEHRVAVHTRGGRTLRGAVRDIDLAKSQFSLVPQGGAAPEAVYHAEVKAIFFMLTAGETPQPANGAKVRVTFADGRSIEGKRDGGEGKHGFFLVPSDAARTNTRRIYVARDAISDLKDG